MRQHQLQAPQEALIQRPELAWEDHADYGITLRHGTRIRTELKLHRHLFVPSVNLSQPGCRTLSIDFTGMPWLTLFAGRQNWRHFQQTAWVDFLLEEDPTDPDVIVVLRYGAWKFERHILNDCLQNFLRFPFDCGDVSYDADE